MRTLLLLVVTVMVFYSCADDSEQTGNASSDTKAPKYISGIAAIDVYGNFEKQGFSTEKDLQAGHCTYTSSMTAGETVYTVRVLGKDASSINKVEATVNYSRPGTTVTEFLGYAASVPYTGANSSAAKEWVAGHFDRGGDTTISGVRFVLTAAIPNARVLALYPN